MAWETGTATGYLDLIDKLISFLTTDATLIGLGQQWQLLEDDTTVDVDEFNVRFAYLKGTGLSGLDNIFVTLQAHQDPSGPHYNFLFNGATGYDASADYKNQPGRITFVNDDGPTLPLWDEPMSYWIFANGRRFVMIARVGTVYMSCYCGFIIPFGTPSEYPYPLFIGGSSGDHHAEYTRTDGYINAFFNPTNYGAFLRDPGGSWLNVANRGTASGTGGSGLAGACSIQPYEPGEIIVRNPYDQSYPVVPCTINLGSSSIRNVYGDLDGVFFTSGEGLASENIITVGADNYFAFQNTFRTAELEFALIKME